MAQPFDEPLIKPLELTQPIRTTTNDHETALCTEEVWRTEYGNVFP
jgi:hypothetical protein